MLLVNFHNFQIWEKISANVEFYIQQKKSFKEKVKWKYFQIKNEKIAQWTDLYWT